MSLSKLIDILHKEGCSLVLEDTHWNIRTFYKKGVRDLEDLLDEMDADGHKGRTMQGSTIADKVIGKAAAGMIAYGGVKEVYADVMSKKAIPLLEDNNIKYSYSTLIDHIIIPKGDNRCPLEKTVAPAKSAEETVRMLREHFKT